MNDEELFKQIIKDATDNPTDAAPENPQEFSVYCDTHYNLYMFIKGEWTNIGLNVTPL